MLIFKIIDSESEINLNYYVDFDFKNNRPTGLFMGNSLVGTLYSHLHADSKLLRFVKIKYAKQFCLFINYRALNFTFANILIEK